MENTGNLYIENRALRFTTIIYYAVMLAAFVIGLYGFLSLLWMATSALDRTPQLLSAVF